MNIHTATTVLRIFQIAAAAALILTLTACGGGKDENGGSPPLPPPTDRTPNLPSGSNPSTFHGPTQTTTLRTPGGQTISTTTSSSIQTASPDPVLHTSQYAAREWVVATPHPQLTSYIHTTWNAEDDTDYLILGAWADQSAPNIGRPLAPIPIGVLFDGPEFRHSTAIPPSAGQATYRGTVTGAYKNTATPGTDHGLFAALVDLQADFQQNRVSGCIGCSGAGLVVVPGSGFPDVASLVRFQGTEIRLQQGTITNADSTYIGAAITAVPPRNSPFSIRQVSGSWRGTFSSRHDDLGNPRAAGGTAEGQITYDNAATLSFSAAFIGGSE